MRLRFVLAAALAVMLCLPITMAGAEAPRNLSKVLDRADFSRAVELKEPTPAWYTPELHRRAVAAGKKGQTVAVPGSCFRQGARLTLSSATERRSGPQVTARTSATRSPSLPHPDF